MEDLKFEIAGSVLWSFQDFERFIEYAYTIKGLSDISFISNEHVWIRSYGEWKPILCKPISSDILKAIINKIYDATGSSSLIAGKPLDFEYSQKKNNSRTELIKFRCNATSCKISNGSFDGINLIMRLIPCSLPTLKELGVTEKDILENFAPLNGLVLLSGIMGSGKSTLMAGFLHEISLAGGRHICTYEDPIEFDLMNIPNSRCPITQVQVGLHIESFTEACRNVSRRAADIMLVGESRDKETLKGMLTAADMGMAVYSTVHTRTVAEIFSRITSIFHPSEQNLISSLLIRSLHLGIQQRLLPTVDGKRCAIREYVVFTEKHKEHLLSVDINKVSFEAQKIVEKDGKTLQEAAQEKYNEGLISKETLNTVLKEKQ